MLRITILARTIQLSDDEHDGLFAGNGPLATLSAKARVAYALGAFDRETRHDIDAIREIRNAFAHARMSLSFDTPEIAQMCSGFHCLMPIETDLLSAREKFEEAANWLLMYLSDEPRRASGISPGATAIEMPSLK